MAVKSGSKEPQRDTEAGISVGQPNVSSCVISCDDDAKPEGENLSLEKKICTKK